MPNAAFGEEDPLNPQDITDSAEPPGASEIDPSAVIFDARIIAGRTAFTGTVILDLNTEELNAMDPEERSKAMADWYGALATEDHTIVILRPPAEQRVSDSLFDMIDRDNQIAAAVTRDSLIRLADGNGELVQADQKTAINLWRHIGEMARIGAYDRDSDLGNDELQRIDHLVRMTSGNYLDYIPLQHIAELTRMVSQELPRDDKRIALLKLLVHNLQQKGLIPKTQSTD